MQRVMSFAGILLRT